MNFFKILNKKSKLQLIFAADIETIVINNKLIPVSIGCQLLKDQYYCYKINPLIITKSNIEEESDRMLESFLNFLCIYTKKNQKTFFIYFHNFGAFDGIFLLNIINKMVLKNKKIRLNFKAIIRNSRIYKINYFNLIFLDSYNLLPNSLKDLAFNFIKEEKIDFKVQNLNLNDYKTPLIHSRLLLYMFNDIKILFKILLKFQNIIYTSWAIDITECLTLSSLSFKIYRKHYMPNNSIYKSTTYSYKYIKQAFFGGLTNVYKPYGKNITAIDCNSLYPYCMATYDMPLGKPKYYISESQCKNIILERFFGFLTVIIEIPYQNIPPLPVKKGEKLIQPFGIIEGTYFSEELKFALKQGVILYKIKTAIAYKRGNIFKKFVTQFYQERQLALAKNNKSIAYIYKILMNSLYGRFAMNPQLSETKFTKKLDMPIMQVLYPNEYASNIINKKFDYQLTTYQKSVNFNIQDLLNLNLTKKIEFLAVRELQKTFMQLKQLNIANHISAAITSYARIEILSIIYTQENKYPNSILYMDTDAIYTDKPIDSSILGKELGQYKILFKNVEGIFLTPKTYIIKDYKKIYIRFKGIPLKYSQKLLWNSFQRALFKSKFKPFYIDLLKKDLINNKIYKLKKILRPSLNFNKRKKVYNKNNFWINTKPIYIQNNY